MRELLDYYHYLLTASPTKDPAPSPRNYNYNLGKIIASVVVTLYIISVCILQSPIIILLTMTIISGIPLLNLIPSSWSISSFTGIFLEHLLKFLCDIGILKFLHLIYIFWYQCLTLKGFKVFYTILHVFVLFYLIIVRYIFHLKLLNLPINNYLYIAYFITFFFLIIKFLTETSTYLITLVCTKYPLILDTLHSEMPEELPEIPKSTTNKSPSQFRSLFGFHLHKHRHTYPPELPSSRFSSYAKLGFALLGLGFTGLAGYNYHRTANAAILSAEAAVRSAEAAVRSADAAEVSAGLMTPEEYRSRHPKK